eukprot:TRINITY_DN1666_c0_g1_i1.p1 TRINITY_DN1666_c0_g1~~TRINITY_DN1666_c0_g1_i1.p1  ORF type:complete len:568 (+),score=147.97 TRINITY_DN1666_c0_g1_i1:116-1819(+)
MPPSATNSILRQLYVVAPIVIGILIFFSLIRPVGAEPTEASIRSQLQAADKLVARGRSSYPKATAALDAALEDAVAFAAAPDTEPKKARLMREKVLFKRSEVHQLSLDRAAALADLSACVEANAHNKGCRSGRYKLATSLGYFVEAADDCRALLILEKTPAKRAALESQLPQLQEYARIWRQAEGIAQTVEQAARAAHPAPAGDAPSVDVDENGIPKGPLPPKPLAATYRALAQRGVDLLAPVATAAPDGRNVRLLRGRLAVHASDHDTVSKEAQWLLSKNAADVDALVLRARGNKLIGATAAVKSALRQCIEVDNDARECVEMLRVVKRFEKAVEEAKGARAADRHKDAVRFAEEAIHIDPHGSAVNELRRWACGALKALKTTERGLAMCTEAIEAEPLSAELVDTILDRAEIHILRDDAKAASGDLDLARNAHQRGGQRGHPQRLETLRVRIERLSKKDLYRILAVPKTANEQEIRRAYRKMAYEYHPDKVGTREGLTDEERQSALDKFEDINLAKDVLLDAEKRRKYDLGEDLEEMGQQRQQRQGGFPFHPGGGGSFQFFFRQG